MWAVSRGAWMAYNRLCPFTLSLVEGNPIVSLHQEQTVPSASRTKKHAYPSTASSSASSPCWRPKASAKHRASCEHRPTSNFDKMPLPHHRGSCEPGRAWLLTGLRSRMRCSHQLTVGKALSSSEIHSWQQGHLPLSTGTPETRTVPPLEFTA